jgi:hypothetical protein
VSDGEQAERSSALNDSGSAKPLDPEDFTEPTD